MATSQEIAALRLNIQEPENSAPYTDDFLGGMIDLYGMDDAEFKIWTAKRNAAAKLVDISEGGSSRKTSQIFDNYDKIVASYGQEADSGDPSLRPSTTRPIERA